MAQFSSNASSGMRPEAALQAEIISLIPRLRRFARVVAGSQDDADDLVQATLERALTRHGQYESGTRLDSWLFRVLKNAWIDEVRARGRRAKVFAPEEAGDQVGFGGAADMEARLEMRAVEEAMSSLPEEDR
ncbi:MAG: RNA polymerase sigma factor, partial [Hyphomonadaceae bacterium]